MKKWTIANRDFDSYSGARRYCLRHNISLKSLVVSENTTGEKIHLNRSVAMKAVKEMGRKKLDVNSREYLLEELEGLVRTLWAYVSEEEYHMVDIEETKQKLISLKAKLNITKISEVSVELANMWNAAIIQYKEYLNK